MDVYFSAEFYLLQRNINYLRIKDTCTLPTVGHGFLSRLAHFPEVEGTGSLRGQSLSC